MRAAGCRQATEEDPPSHVPPPRRVEGDYVSSLRSICDRVLPRVARSWRLYTSQLAAAAAALCHRQVALVLADNSDRYVAEFGLNLLLSAVRAGKLPADASADLCARLSAAVEGGAVPPESASRICVVLSALAGPPPIVCSLSFSVV